MDKTKVLKIKEDEITLRRCFNTIILKNANE